MKFCFHGVPQWAVICTNRQLSFTVEITARDENWQNATEISWQPHLGTEVKKERRFIYGFVISVILYSITLGMLVIRNIFPEVTCYCGQSTVI